MTTGVNFPIQSTWKGHLIGFLYPLILAYLVIQWGYRDEKYFYYFFIPAIGGAGLHHLHNVIIIPIVTTLLIAIFGVATFFFFKTINILNHFRETLLAGLLIIFFSLLQTILVDTEWGSFFNPIWIDDLPFQTIYVRGAISLFLIVIYYLVPFFLLKRPDILGSFSLCFLYFPLMPFIFDISPLYNGCLLIIGLSTFILIANRLEKFEPKSKLFLRRFTLIYTVLLFLGSFVFRLWALIINNESSLLLSISDSSDYLLNAKDFWDGDPLFQPRSVPAYSFLIYLFFKVVGFDIFRGLIISAILGSLIPVFIFLFTRMILGLAPAIMAGLSVALSENLIYYSSINHRATPAAFCLIVALFLLYQVNIRKEKIFYFGFGFFFGWTMLLEGVLAPLGVLIFLPFFRKDGFKPSKLIFLYGFLGFLFAQIPFQWAIYQRYETVFPFGRDLAALSISPQWNMGFHPEGKVLSTMGFDPFRKPLESFKVFWQQPGLSAELLLKKSFKDLQNYFLDRQTNIFDPVLLNRETYFASFSRFYYFILLLFGMVAIVFVKRLHWTQKMFVCLPVFYPIFFNSLFVMGNNRYRMTTQPLLLLVFSFGLYLALHWLVPKLGNCPSQSIGVFKCKILKVLENSLLKKSRIIKGVSSALILLMFFICINQNRTRVLPFPKNDKIGLAGGKLPVKKVLNIRNNTLPGPLIINKDISVSGNYSIAIRFTSNFGYRRQNDNFLLLLNNRLVNKGKIPKESRWIYFQNVKINKGRQKFSLIGSFNFKSDSRVSAAGGYFGGLGKKVDVVGTYKLTGFELNRLSS